MLLNFDPLRAIVLRDRLLLLVPDGADGMLQKLERSVRGGLAQKEDEVFGSKEGREEEDDHEAKEAYKKVKGGGPAPDDDPHDDDDESVGSDSSTVSASSSLADDPDGERAF